MLFELVSSIVVASGLGYLKLKEGKSDANKIEKICRNAGLFIKENGNVKTIQIQRRTNFEGGTEYAFRIPLGLSFSDFQKKMDTLQDGLNNKKTILDVQWNDVKEINLKGDIKQQIKELINKTKIRKEIEMEFDGLLKIRVYNTTLTDNFPFNDSLLQHCTGWKIPIGTDQQGILFHDTDKFPHMIVAGLTRYGKTVFLKMFISTLTHTQPKYVSFSLVDLKGGLAFSRFKNCKQVQMLATNPTEALSTLKAVQKNMEQRMKVFQEKGYEDIKEAGYKDRHFIIVDEGAEIASKGETDQVIKKIKMECESIIADIARRGAGIGYRLIFCTQYPTADTLPRQVKQNANAKLCFYVDTEIASRVVLDESGAELLPLIPGRAIYRTDRKRTIQTPFIQNDFIDKIIKPHLVRKDEQHEVPRKTTKRGSDSVEFEEIGLSE